MPKAIKGITFRLREPISIEHRWIFEEFRLAVNNIIRLGLQSGVTSRFKLTKLLYKDMRPEFAMYAHHFQSAIAVATIILKNYRKAVRKGLEPDVPYTHRLMLRAENQAYKLERKTGEIDLPLKAGQHIKLNLVVSEYHKKFLSDESLHLGSMTVFLDRVLIAFSKDIPKYEPESALSLDTNEASLDGIFVNGNIQPVRLDYGDIPVIQLRSADKRSKIQKKKHNDRRVLRRLARKVGKREHDRIEYRLHKVANAVIKFAKEHKSAIVIEDLTNFKPKKSKYKYMNRRLSSWMKGKLHQILEYKSQWSGVPLMKINPYNSSRTCPRCGWVNTRLGKSIMFVCKTCGWVKDRHTNASMNLLKTAISFEVVRGLRFDLDGLHHDAVKTLYEPAMVARSEPSGVRSVTA